MCLRHQSRANFSNVLVATKKKYYETSYSEWFVHEDGSVSHDSENHDPEPPILHYGMELSSPIFNSESEATSAITQVCDIINSRYESFVTEKCGLHVHVGRGLDGTLELQELKNLFAILWTFETRLHLLHPTHRRTNITACVAMHDHSELSKRKIDPLSKLSAILNCQSKDELLRLVNNTSETAAMGFFTPWAYNGLRFWTGVQESSLSTERTFEFRQHEGSLNANQILIWARVCVRLVGFAERTSQSDLSYFLRLHLDDDEGFTAADLIEYIGLPADAQYYREAVAQRAVNDE